MKGLKLFSGHVIGNFYDKQVVFRKQLFNEPISSMVGVINRIFLMHHATTCGLRSRHHFTYHRMIMVSISKGSLLGMPI